MLDLPPREALDRLVRFTFDHHNSHEDFIRLVMIENIHHAAYLAKSEVIQQLNIRAIDAVAGLYRRGVDQGVFRTGLDPIELHWQISALCFFNVSNRATFSKIFKRDLGSKQSLAALARPGRRHGRALRRRSSLTVVGGDQSASSALSDNVRTSSSIRR